jgi:hypothetical protein
MPGRGRLLLRAQTVSQGVTVHVLAYMWQEQRVVATVVLASPKAKLVSVSFIGSLARHQDARIRLRLAE